MGVRRVMDYMVLRTMDAIGLHIVSGVNISEPKAIQPV